MADTRCWIFLGLLSAFATPALAQSFRVQCPTGTITHPNPGNSQSVNNSEPAYTGIDDTMLLDVLRNALRMDRERHGAAAARAAKDRRLDRLTQREREILTLIAQGHQNREIAAQLGISARTVEVHKARIMEKLECQSLAELMQVNRAH